MYNRTQDTPFELAIGSATLEGKTKKDDADNALLKYNTNNTYSCFYLSNKKDSVLWNAKSPPNPAMIVVPYTLFLIALSIFIGIWVYLCTIQKRCLNNPCC